MIKYCLVVVSLLICISTVAQNITDLNKYSYCLFNFTNKYRIVDGERENQIVVGTCYFIKKNKKLYLVTAAHILTGIPHFQEKLDFSYPDSLFLILNNKHTQRNERVSLSIKDIKNNVDSNYNELPDVIVWQIKLPERFPVYSVEKFMSKKEIERSNIDTAIIFGYIDGLEKQSRIMDIKSLKMWPLSHSPNVETFSYNFIEGVGGGGSSGAPLLYVMKDKKVSFAGHCIAGDGRKQMLFLPQKYILNALKNTRLATLVIP